MKENKTPQLFLWNNDDDFVVAPNPLAASRIMQGRCECDGTWRDGHNDQQLWEMISDERTLVLSGEEKTVGNWIGEKGEGWLAARWLNGAAVLTTYLPVARKTLKQAA